MKLVVKKNLIIRRFSSTGKGAMLAFVRDHTDLCNIAAMINNEDVNIGTTVRRAWVGGIMDKKSKDFWFSWVRNPNEPRHQNYIYE